jgi:hypothetical protein
MISPSVLMKAVVFNKTLHQVDGLSVIVLRATSGHKVNGCVGTRLDSVELIQEQNTTNSISLTFLRWTNGSEVNVFMNCFKAKLPNEIEFCVLCAKYLVSG